MNQIVESPVAALESIDPLSGSAWDEIVSRHPDSTIFHTGAWARVLFATYGYKPHYFADRDALHPAALCLFEVNSWLTGRRGISLPFTDECGPLTNATHSFDDLFQHSLRIARERNWKSVEIRNAPQEAFDSPSLSFYSHTLDLRPGSDALFGKLNSSVRRAIRKAEKSGIEFSITRDPEGMQEYFRLHCLTRKKHGLPPQPASFFQNIQSQIIEARHGFVAFAFLNGEPIAGHVFFTYKNRALYKFGASNPQFDQLRPNNLVMWRSLEHLSKEGLGRLDLGRTSLGNEGLRRYKLNWGSAERRVSYIKWNRRVARFVQDKDQSGGWHTFFFQHFPIKISRAAGTLLYPHIP